MPGAGQDVPQAADDQSTDEGRIAEADLRLGRVDVDVHQGRIEIKVEGGGRVAVAGQEVGVGGPQRALQQAVAHRPAVDEQVLVRRVAPVVGGQAGEAGQPHALALLVHGQGVVGEVTAQD